MKNKLLETIELVNSRRAYNQQLQGVLWGTVEVRQTNAGQYIYLHRRESGIAKTLYVGEYSKELCEKIEQNNNLAKDIKRKLREINTKLKQHNFSDGELSEQVQRNVDFAKRNIVDTIYKQAVLEGVAVTYLDTETIIEGGKVSNISAPDIQKINNLKHAWQFTLEEGVLKTKSDFNILCLINRFVEEGFYYNAGVLRSVPVAIGGTKWKPTLPIESAVKSTLDNILMEEDVYLRAIKSLLYITKSQLFIDGNKRTAVIFANHILISNGKGLMVIPEEFTEEYKRLLIKYYETGESEEITTFLFDKCLTKI